MSHVNKVIQRLATYGCLTGYVLAVATYLYVTYLLLYWIAGECPDSRSAHRGVLGEVSAGPPV